MIKRYFNWRRILQSWKCAILSYFIYKLKWLSLET